MSPQSGLRRYTLPGIAALTVAVGLVGAMYLETTHPVLTMPGVLCPVDNITAEQVSALRASGLAHLRVVKFAPARPVSGGFVLDAMTLEEVRQWAHENRIACEDVKYGYSYLCCRGVEANKLGPAGLPVSELWLSFGSNGHLIDVDAYRRDMSANDTTAAWDGARHALRDVLSMSASTMGDVSSAVLGASPLQTARLQWRFSDHVVVATASSLPYAGLAVREQHMSSHL